MEREEFILNGLREDFENATIQGAIDPLAEPIAGIDGKSSKIIEAGAPVERQQFLNFLPLLPKHIREGLLSGKYQISGHSIYAEKAINGTAIEMFKASDRFETGKSNVDGNKLAKDTYQGISAIKVIYSTVPSDDAAYQQKFIPDLVLAGDVKFWHRNKGLLPKGFPMTQFGSLPGYAVNNHYGLHRLLSPKMLFPDEEFTFDINFTRAINAGYLRVELIGATILPA